MGTQAFVGEAGRSDVAGGTGPGGGSAFGSSDARQALVLLNPTAAEVVKRTPDSDPAMTAPQPTPWLRPQKLSAKPEPELLLLQEELAEAAPATTSASDAAIITVSTAGAATEVVHSGGGCTSGSGPLVKMREHPGLATRTSVASEMRSTVFTVPP
jgi:hypothetical protein